MPGNAHTFRIDLVGVFAGLILFLVLAPCLGFAFDYVFSLLHSVWSVRVDPAMPVLLGIGAAAISSALLAERIRAALAVRFRRPASACDSCGYSLEGLPTARCPECGHLNESSGGEAANDPSL